MYLISYVKSSYDESDLRYFPDISFFSLSVFNYCHHIHIRIILN